MEQQFISLINKKITEYYQAIKSLLFNKESYCTKVNTQNVSLYFTFLESSLQQPFNRLTSVSSFIICDDGQLLTDKMYPFALLAKEKKEKINGIFSQAVNLANSLEVSGIDPEFHSLCEEKFLENHHVEDNSN